MVTIEKSSSVIFGASSPTRSRSAAVMDLKVWARASSALPKIPASALVYRWTSGARPFRTASGKSSDPYLPASNVRIRCREDRHPRRFICDSSDVSRQSNCDCNSMPPGYRGRRRNRRLPVGYRTQARPPSCRGQREIRFEVSSLRVSSLNSRRGARASLQRLWP